MPVTATVSGPTGLTSIGAMVFRDAAPTLVAVAKRPNKDLVIMNNIIRTTSTTITLLALSGLPGCDGDDGETPSGNHTAQFRGDIVEFSPTVDTFVRSGAPHKPQVTEDFLRLKKSGRNKILVQFDQAEIDAAVGEGTLLSAELVFQVSDLGNNWSAEGREIDLHRMTIPWTANATWNCADDPDPSNSKSECDPKWEMGNGTNPWDSEITASELIANGYTGPLVLDVTQDVLSGQSSTGWILKKREEGQSGRIEFDSNETGNGPLLRLDIDPIVDNCPDDPDKLEPGICGCGTPDEVGSGCLIECPIFDDALAYVQSEFDRFSDGLVCLGEQSVTCDGESIEFSSYNPNEGEFGGISVVLDRFANPYVYSGVEGFVNYCDTELVGMIMSVGFLSFEPTNCQILFDEACAAINTP